MSDTQVMEGLDPQADVIHALQQGRRFLVTSHPSPDGDAIGCTAAALLLLQSMGREVVAYNPDPVPRRFRFLPGTEQFVDHLTGHHFDTTVVMDCSPDRVLDRCGVPRPQLGTVVVIDHHKTPCTDGDVIYQDPAAAAVGVLLFRLFRRMGVDLSVAAEPLFCTVMSDTGSFRYQNTDPEAMRVSAELLELGVDPWNVASHLYEDQPARELRLLGQVLRTLEVSDDGLCASLTVTPEMLADCGCTPDVVDGMINYARGVAGAQVAILLRPDPGGVRVSLRSRGSADVAAVAERFGGGGHHNAAGFSRADDLPLVRRELFAEVARMLGKADLSAKP